jgi:RNA polymerase sigma-70 factor (ECF subfamily)
LDEEKEKDRISDDLDPSTQVETEETLTDNKEIILKCLEKLGKKQKKCLVLRYFHNKSYNDIAEEMGISDSSVGYNINAGISNLKKLVENHHKSERNKSRISS